jgi:protein SHQ1
MTGTAKYGFNNQYSSFFVNLQDEILTIIDLPDPETSTPASRKSNRKEDEDNSFDEEHYM